MLNVINEGFYMTSITFDTLSTARRLREKGASQELAEAIADEMRLNASVDITHLATREDLKHYATKADLKLALAENNAENIKYMFNVFIALVWLLIIILIFQ